MRTAEASPDQGGLRLDRRDAAVLAALALLAVVVLWPMLAAPSGYAPGIPGQDGRTQWYPWRVFGFGSLKDGTVPLWNPHVLCGVPFVGNFQSALFYPPNLIFAVAHAATAARWSLWFHVALSLVFTYLLGRRLGMGRGGAAVGAMTFGFCAAELLRAPAGHWGVWCAIPWLPLSLLCAEGMMRRPGRMVFVVGAVSVAMQVLSGVPQYVFITAVAVGVFALVRGFGEGWSWGRRVARWGLVAGMFAGGAAISAIQLFPGIEAAFEGTRSLPMRGEWSEVFSLGPECLLTLVVPEFFGGGAGQGYWGRWLFWEMNAYVGVVGLGLAGIGLLWGRPRRTAARFAVLAAVMLVLALGRHTPLAGVVRWLVPVGGMLRGAAKFLLPFSLAAAMLAGMGGDAFARARSRGEIVRFAIPAGVLVGVIMVIVLCGGLIGKGLVRILASSGECLYAPGSVRPDLGAIMAGGIFSAALLVCLVGTRLLLRHAAAAAAVMVVLVALDLSHFAWMFTGRGATFRATGSAWPDQGARVVEFLGGRERTAALGVAAMNDAMLEGARTSEGIEPNPPARFHLLYCAAEGRPADVAPSLYPISRGRAAARMGVGRILCRRSSRPGIKGGRVLWADGEWELLQLPSAVERVFVAYERGVAASPVEALKATLATDLRRTVVLEEDGLPEQGGEGSRTTGVGLRIDRPNLVEVEARLTRPGWLVLMDNYFPGWRAEVDGRPERILRANFAFRAVPVSAGRHVVTFLYRPRSVVAGFMVSVAAIVVCVVMLIFYSLDLAVLCLQ